MRLYRRPVALALLFALLFVQIATATYACTTERPASIEDAVAVVGASDDCEGMQMPAGDQASPYSPLCVDHCTHATDATADSHLPALHWLPVLVMVLTIVASDLGGVDQRAAGSVSPSLARAIEPPIPIFLGRFLS